MSRPIATNIAAQLQRRQSLASAAAGRIVEILTGMTNASLW